MNKLYLLTYHNLDSDHDHHLFTEEKKAIDYAVAEIKYFDGEDSVIDISEPDINGDVSISGSNNETGYTLKRVEVNRTFSRG